MTPHLFAQWDRIARRIRENQRVVMFLDFDGTLVRIASMPGNVRLEDGMRDVLRKLAAHRNVTLAVISGRQRAELQDEELSVVVVLSAVPALRFIPFFRLFCRRWKLKRYFYIVLTTYLRLSSYCHNQSQEGRLWAIGRGWYG